MALSYQQLLAYSGTSSKGSQRWRQQRSKDFSLDFYVDEKLVNPEELRKPIFRSLRWGHPSRDAMLQAIADIWSPQIYRDVLLAKSCSQCQKAGKNIKTLITQPKFGKVPALENHNEKKH